MISLRFIAVVCLLALAVACSDSNEASDPAPAATAGVTATTVAPTAADGGGDEPLRQTQLDVGEFTFDALEAGPLNGELVLLLHGFPQTSYEWRAQIAALAEAGYRAVAPDQRGYSPGARPDGAEAYAIDLIAEDTLGMVDALGYETFHVVGHDWGAVVAWVLAAQHPERVISVTGVSVPHPLAFAEAIADPEGTQAQMSSYFDFFQSSESTAALLADDSATLRALYTGAGLTDDDMQTYVDALGTEEALDAALNWYRALEVAPAGAAVPAVAVPTLFVWSTADVAIGRQAAELNEKYVTGPYRFEVLEGVSHWIPEEAADELTALLLAHLQDLSSRR